MSVIQTREIAPKIVRLGSGRAPGRGAADGRQAESGLSGRDMLRVLRRRKWLIILTELIFVSLAVGATLLWLTYAPWYTAEALLEVSPPAISAMQPDQRYVPTTMLEVLAIKYARFVRSESVLQVALATEKMRATNWLKKSPDDALLRLQEMLNVAPVSASALIQISATGTNKKELPDIVNAVAESARDQSIEIANRGKQLQIGQLRTERDRLTDQRDRLRADKAKLVRDAAVPDMLSQRSVLEMELHELAQQISLLELELAQAEGQLELIRNQIQTGEIGNLPAVLQALDLDPSLRSLQMSLLNMKASLPNVEYKYGKDHRMYISFVTRMESSAKEVQERTNQLIEAQVKSILANTEANKSIILDRLTKTREKYHFVDVSVRKMRATYSAYSQLEDQDSILTDQIDRIDSRLVDLRILLQGSAPLDIMNRASTPLEPSMPKWEIMIPLGVLLGLIVGLGLSFMLEFVDTSIKGPSDVARRIDLPMLGMVPHHDDVE
ncbi:MAG: hypothetical protein ISS78_06485, partial [Phycisphaerae bacterium]|nr:hypothetical protein [Phycisphaerae bacterium]